jgi:hypothetical protein
MRQRTRSLHLSERVLFDFTLLTAVHASVGNVDVIHVRSIAWPVR